jgi:hypothetical protein
VIIIYLCLDIARMSAATAGIDSTRKTLSIILAILDLLRGDWKKAIMTIMGYVDSSSLFIGQFGKVFLFLFQTLSPRIQEQFVYGTYDTIKSFIIGLLFTIFKVTAPFGVRMPVIKVLETISKHKKDIDGTLKAADLEPLPDYMSPTFDDLNNLQAIMDDPAFLCSKEHHELVESANQSNMINVILQMARIPVSEQFIKYKCGTKPARSFIEELADRQGIKYTPSFNENKIDIWSSDAAKKFIQQMQNGKRLQDMNDESKTFFESISKDSASSAESSEEKAPTESLPPTIDTSAEPPKDVSEESLPPTISTSAEPPKDVSEESLPPTIGGKRSSKRSSKRNKIRRS